MTQSSNKLHLTIYIIIILYYIINDYKFMIIRYGTFDYKFNNINLCYNI